MKADFNLQDISFLLPVKESGYINANADDFTAILKEVEKLPAEKRDLTQIKELIEKHNTLKELAKTKSNTKTETSQKTTTESENEPETKKEQIKGNLENQLVNAIAINVPHNLQGLKEILLFIKEKITSALNNNPDFYDSPTFIIKLDKELCPLSLNIQKQEGKFKIVIFSTGDLKQELLNNMGQLIEHLKLKGIAFSAIQVEEYKRDKEDSNKHRQDQRQQQEEISFLDEIEEISDI